MQRSIYNFGQILSDRIAFTLSAFRRRVKEFTTHFVSFRPLRNQRPFCFGRKIRGGASLETRKPHMVLKTQKRNNTREKGWRRIVTREDDTREEKRR